MDGTRDAWVKRVEDWQSSGLDAAKFASKHGLSEASLKWWKWKLGTKKRSRSKKRPKAPVISPLTFVEMAPTTAEGLEIVLASGLRIRVSAGFDPIALSQLLDVLERRK